MKNQNCFTFLLILMICFIHTNGQNSTSGFLECKVTINGISPDKISKSQLIDAKSLIADSSEITITGFKFSLFEKNKEAIILGSAHDAFFTREMKVAISECHTPTKIYIEYIRCIDSKNQIHNLRPIEIKIP